MRLQAGGAVSAVLSCLDIEAKLIDFEALGRMVVTSPVGRGLWATPGAGWGGQGTAEGRGDGCLTVPGSAHARREGPPGLVKGQLQGLEQVSLGLVWVPVTGLGNVGTALEVQCWVFV